jgi:hypothetical protein
MRDASLSIWLFAALDYRMTQAEDDAWQRPPYPTPAAQRPFRLRLEEEVRARLERGGPDPVATVRLFDVQHFVREAELALKRVGPFEANDAVCLLIGGGNLDVEDAHTILDALPDSDELGAKFIQLPHTGTTLNTFPNTHCPS